MSRRSKWIVSFSLAVFAIAACSALRGSAVAKKSGAELYATHCAVCHGLDGQGDGPASSLLYPPARDFSRGRFRLVSTLNGAPTHSDLVATLARGVPGSAMPAWSWMPRESLDDLAKHVRTLAERGLAKRLSSSFSEADARAEARERLAPAARVDPPVPASPTRAVFELGRRSYAEHCAACHGPEGRGEQIAPETNEDGSPNWARDLTAGFFKGGASQQAIATRIVVGMPGSSMPAFSSLPREELAALAAYVASLAPVDADRWLVHEQGTLHAKHAAAGTPLRDGCEATDERWSAAEEIDVVLAPLVWRNDAVFAARVSALHDGSSLAVRVRWRDATRDEGALDQPEGPDAAALALSNEAAPPLFGMGSRAHPVNLWHWRSTRLVDRAGVFDLLDTQPHLLRSPVFDEGRADVKPHYLPAPSEPLSGGVLEELSAESFSTVRELDANAKAVASTARWAGGEWAVVFVRDLAPRNELEADLRRGRPIVFAAALWDGAGGDLGGRKSISIWQKLVVD